MIAPGEAYKLKSGAIAEVLEVRGDTLTYRIAPLSQTITATITKFQAWVTDKA